MRHLAFILSLNFSVLALLPHNDSCELKKLPALFSHYQEHKDRDGDSFLEFLLEDYFTNKGDKEGHHNNSSTEDLPFQNHTNHNHCCNFNVVIYDMDISEVTQTEVKTVTPYRYSYSSLYLDSIFQPPKV